MDLKFTNGDFPAMYISITDPQALGCFEALQTLTDSETACDGVTSNLWVNAHTALSAICDHYADILRTDAGLTEAWEWDLDS